MQPLTNIGDDGFGESDCVKDEVRILSIFSISKKSNKANYLTSGIKKGDQAVKRYGKGNKDSKYLTPDTKKVFNLLRHIFTQTAILHHFDLEWYIWIETRVSNYAIGRLFSLLTIDDLGQ